MGNMHRELDKEIHYSNHPSHKTLKRKNDWKRYETGYTKEEERI